MPGPGVDTAQVSKVSPDQRTVEVPVPVATATSESTATNSPVLPPAAASRVPYAPPQRLDGPLPPINNAPAQVLSAWTALEVLNPQTFTKPEQLAAGGRSANVAALDAERLPWEVGEKAQPNTKLYYHLVLGTLDVERAFTALLDRFSDKREERPRVKGEAIVATAVLDKSGRLAGKPAVALSSFAWALPVALEQDLSALSEWPAAAQSLEEQLEGRLRRQDSDGNELPLDRGLIQGAYNWLCSTLRIDAGFVAPPRFAIRAYEYFKSSEPPDPLLLNSFFLGDLARAQRLAASGALPLTLRRFLGAEGATVRHDLLNDPAALESAVAPSLIPPARWPSNGRHPLVLLQQAAVNLALRDLREGGILAVNGPPGTGKTTLLRDVVAALVTERAEAMCSFDEPAGAFTHQGQMKAGAGWLHLYAVSPALIGREIVVASSNNAAVENVSAELPGIGAVAGDADLHYFRSLSNALLGRETWGLAAAVLGNAANRGRFRKTFWWDDDVGLSTYLMEAAGTPQWIDEKAADGNMTQRKPRIVVEEKPPDGLPTALQRWKAARSAFQVALKSSRTALAELAALRQAIQSLPELAAALATAEAAASAAHEVLEKATRAREAAVQTEAKRTADRDAARAALDAHEHAKPVWWARLVRTAGARAWSAQETDVKRAAAVTERDRAGATADLIRAQQHEAAAESEVRKKATEREQARGRYAAAEGRVAAAQERFGPHQLDDAFWARGHETRQVTVPWCDVVVHRLRDDLFGAALRAHKAFIDAAAKPIRHNLGALMNAMGPTGGPLTGPKAALLPEVWATLFLVVPVVSTTFASVERMLGALPPESLGWLLVDEAGQALPQAAVGALMRARRALIVGDPMQIEPVVALPESLTDALCRRFGVDPDRYNAPAASVQTLADAATAYFATFEGRHGSREVGVPLLVHRRCADPMFGIANAVAYEGLMVQAKASKPSRIGDCLGASRWIDVQGAGRDKWCPEEGEEVVRLLQQLSDAGVPANLYVVTPFVVVAENLRRRLVGSGVLAAWISEPWKWANERVGTVHTVQGREAEAVIFVLGAPDPQQRGARGWAGGKPNLLNVALTRAQEVVYVVGNRRLWHEAGVFRRLDQGI